LARRESLRKILLEASQKVTAQGMVFPCFEKHSSLCRKGFMVFMPQAALKFHGVYAKVAR
jgi:hypothetical protein